MVENTNTSVQFDSTTIRHIRLKYRYSTPSRILGHYSTPNNGPISNIFWIARGGRVICRSLFGRDAKQKHLKTGHFVRFSNCIIQPSKRPVFKSTMWCWFFDKESYPFTNPERDSNPALDNVSFRSWDFLRDGWNHTGSNHTGCPAWTGNWLPRDGVQDGSQFV